MCIRDSRSIVCGRQHDRTTVDCVLPGLCGRVRSCGRLLVRLVTNHAPAIFSQPLWVDYADLSTPSTDQNNQGTGIHTPVSCQICRIATRSLQADLDSLQRWEHDWLIEFNPSKSEAITFTKKTKPVKGDYKLHNQGMCTHVQFSWPNCAFNSDLDNWRVTVLLKEMPIEERGCTFPLSCGTCLG